MMLGPEDGKAEGNRHCACASAGGAKRAEGLLLEEGEGAGGWRGPGKR